MAGFYFVLAIYLQRGRGLSAFDAGLVFLANGAGYLCTSSQTASYLRGPAQRLIAISAGVRIAGLAALVAAAMAQAYSMVWLIAGLFLNGAGTGLAISPLVSNVLARVQKNDAGLASGLLSTALQLGNAIGVAAIGVVFYSTGINAAGFVRGVVYLIGVNIILLALVRHHCHKRTIASFIACISLIECSKERGKRRGKDGA
jgi:predicted MFS family arabinose efflux permease